MMNSAQHRDWFSRVRLQVAGAALVFAVMLGLGMVATRSARAQTFTVLQNFTDGADGGDPAAGLVWDTAGNFYGTTYNGGGGECVAHAGCGAVFKLSKTGTLTVLHGFAGGSSDGGNPLAGLVRDAAGNLYGNTDAGGGNGCYNGFGCGTVFKVDRTGTETVLYSFTGEADGCQPSGDLLRDKAGNLYGTAGSCGSSNQGTVYKLSKSGTLTVLHSFAGGPSDGGNPVAGVILDAKGNLYGETYQGGPSSGGVVYKLSKSGKLTLLHSFTGGADGCYPYGGLLRNQGTLYGTAFSCGAYNAGVVYKLSKSGALTVLHNFAGGTADGGNPAGGVITDAKGNLYGDTDAGGGTGCYEGLGCGTVYKLSKAGKLTVLHSINGGTDGANPYGGVTRDTKGNLYGTAMLGGSDNAGTVWKLTP